MKNKNIQRGFRHLERLTNEDGFALVTTVLLLIVLGVLVFVSTKWSAMDIKRTANYTKTRDVFYTAEAGLQSAFNYMNYDAATGKCPGTAGDGFDDELGDGTSFGGDWPSSSFQNVDFNGGTYTVTVVDNNDDADQTTDIDFTVVLNSTASKKNFTGAIEAVVFRPLFEADGALITEGDLTGNGSFTVTGTAGTAHSNGDFDQSGISGTTLFSSATGTCSGTTCSNAGGGSLAAYEPLPYVTDNDIEKFKNKSNYVLRDDGKIDIHDLSLDPSDANFSTTLWQDTWTSSPPGPPTTVNCWKPDGDTSGTDCRDPGDPWYSYYLDLDSVSFIGAGRWKIGGDKAPQDAMVYVAGDITITGSPDPWTVSIVTMGYIDLTGNPTIRNYRDTNVDTATQDMLFLAGTDFEMGGNVTIGSSGAPEQAFVLARDQMSVAGDIYMRGWIMSTEYSPTDENLVTSNVISGSLVIEYNGDMQAPFLGCKLNVLSWKEVGSGIS